MATNMLKERLEEALNKKNNDINSFIWKGKKSIKDGKIIQEEKRLVDCSVEELKQFYKHCETMLYNTSRDNPGRYKLLDIITEQRNKCNTELFLRWLTNDAKTSKYAFMLNLQKFINNNPTVTTDDGEVKDIKEMPISYAVGNCPEEFVDLPIKLVLAGCLNCLGKFYKQHITLTFLMRQGVYLTAEDLKNKDKNISKTEYIRQILDLKPEVNIYIDYRGLSLEQMRAMVDLHSKQYSELSTLQLELLRNRILFSLENTVHYHIEQWEERERQIKLVLASKGCNVLLIFKTN